MFKMQIQLNHQVILEVGNGVVFAGKYIGIYNVNGEDGYMVQTDKTANVCVWSACSKTKKILEVPIKEQVYE